MLKCVAVIVAVAMVMLPFGAAFAATKPVSPRDGFVKSCETQMLMNAAQCGCMADKAETDLDALSIAYLSLGATDVTHTAATAKAMTPKELAAVDKFMRTAPGICEGAK